MRIAIATDAWRPQVNGVARTLATTTQQLTALGHDVLVIEPSLFNTFPCPSYPEIRLAFLPSAKAPRLLDAFAPDAIHIATEGPIGWAVREYCLRRALPFTTSYHTQFPEYVRARAPIPLKVSYAFMRQFHSAAARTMVATPTVEKLLVQRGFRNLARWTRGVDLEVFRPGAKATLLFPRPISMYMGRVAIEKNIEDFLRLQIAGTKVVVGDGPARAQLESRHPTVKFLGFHHGDALAALVAAADVFVFPSRTDTFGLSMLEAMACGVPVAAYPVAGPIDVVVDGVSGALDHELGAAVQRALGIPATEVRNHALRYTWAAATAQFIGNLAPISRSATARVT